MADVAGIDLTGWVQAIGSIAAIWVSGRLVEKTTRQARLEKLYGVDGIFHLTADTLTEAANVVANANIAPDPLLRFADHRLKDCAQLLDQVFGELLAIGSEKLPGMTSEARDAVAASIAALASAKQSITTTGNIIQYRDTLNASAQLVGRHRNKILTFVAGQRRRVNYWYAI